MVLCPGWGLKVWCGLRGQELAYSPKRAQKWLPRSESLHTPWTLTGEQTKALVTQLTLFNQILVELRDDIRDQVWVGPAKEAPDPGVGWQVRRADCY